PAQGYRDAWSFPSVCSVDQRQRRAQKRFVRRGDDAAPLRHGLAVEIGDSAARTLQDRNERLYVPGLEARLRHEIDPSCGDHGIGIGIAAITREPRCGEKRL